MQIARIESCALAEFDDAITCVVFFQGCDSNCRFCQNPQLIAKTTDMEPTDWQHAILNLQLTYVDWLSLTGGEVLCQEDKQGILDLCKAVKQYKPKIKINLDMSSNITLGKAFFFVKLAEHLDCVSIDIKHWTARTLLDVSILLNATGMVDKCRVRTVVVENIPADPSVATLLVGAGIKRVRMLKNSMEGRGKDLPPTDENMLKKIHEYYSQFGLDFYW
jgi:pyruvate-formate lyase-activating enzyme